MVFVWPLSCWFGWFWFLCFQHTLDGISGIFWFWFPCVVLLVFSSGGFLVGGGWWVWVLFAFLGPGSAGLVVSSKLLVAVRGLFCFG